MRVMNYKRLADTEQKIKLGTFSVDLLPYGFKLNERYPNSIHFTYPLQIAGNNYSLCDKTYLRLNFPEKNIFIGTHHHGAYYFLIKAYNENLLTGKEIVLHIDQSIHPDNRPLETTMYPKISADLLEHVKFMNSFDRYQEKLVITVANYVTALKNVFPEADLYYLHDGVYAPSDWSGSKFLVKKPLLEYALDSNPDIIASIDLDIFVQTSIFNSHKYLLKLLEIARKAKIVMFFTSPGYIYRDKVIKYLEKILAGLIS